MPNTATPDACDVVVIGAGIGGLTSAALLAKAGLDVCVVEAETHCGGYMAGFRRGPFAFDTAVHWLNQCGEGGFVRRVFDLLGPGAPKTGSLKRIRRYKGESFDYLLTNRPDDLRDALIRDFPADEQGIRAFFALAERISRSLKRLRTCMRDVGTMPLMKKAVFGLTMLKLNWRMIRQNGWTTDEGLARYFQSEGLRRVFGAEEDFNACVVPIAWAYADDYQLPPAGGGPEFPRWLCAVLEAFGASVAYRCRVTEVLLEGGRAAGVRIERGRKREPATIESRWVIAACDVEALYERMLPAGTIPTKLIESLRDADLYDSSVTISLGLDCDPRQLGFDEELISICREELSREEQRSGDPHKAGISVMAPSLRDPTLCPPGKGTLTIYVKANIAWSDRWRTGPNYERGDAYKALKQEYTDIILERVEAAVAPGLREHIEICDTATPVSHWRWTGNRYGSIMGARPTTKNIRARIAHYRTPIEGLLLGGMWAEYGGGIPVAMRAGMNSALIVLQRERPAAFRILRDVFDGRRDPKAVDSPELKTLGAPAQVSKNAVR